MNILNTEDPPTPLLLSFNYKFETHGLNTERAILGNLTSAREKASEILTSGLSQKKSLSVHFIEKPTGASPATDMKPLDS